MRRALVLHLTLGASCGYDVEMLNEKVNAPPLRTQPSLVQLCGIAVCGSFTRTSSATHGSAGKRSEKGALVGALIWPDGNLKMQQLVLALPYHGQSAQQP